MVTVEDLIEEVVGDIRDEHDESTPTSSSSADGWRVSGLLRTDEVADALSSAPEGDYETIGGLVMHVLGHIPAAGESVELTARPRRPARRAAALARHRGGDGRLPRRCAGSGPGGRRRPREGHR